MSEKYKFPQPRCSKCRILLSSTYPWDLCPKCWQEKYHAPPGRNYFPPDKAATKRANPLVASDTIVTTSPCARASSQVSDPSVQVMSCS